MPETFFRVGTVVKNNTSRVRRVNDNYSYGARVYCRPCVSAGLFSGKTLHRSCYDASARTTDKKRGTRRMDSKSRASDAIPSLLNETVGRQGSCVIIALFLPRPKTFAFVLRGTKRVFIRFSIQTRRLEFRFACPSSYAYTSLFLYVSPMRL